MPENAEAIVDGEPGDDPGCRVRVMPPVVIATGSAFDVGSVIVSEPIIIMLGPRIMVLLPCVIVDAEAPSVKVVPSSMISVTDDSGRGAEGSPVDLGLAVDLRDVPGWRVMVKPSVDTTVCPVADEGTTIVRVPMTIALVPSTMLWLFLVTVKIWLPLGSVYVVPSKMT